jgi:hypothetical protein
MPQIELVKYKYPLSSEMESSIILEAKKNNEDLEFIDLEGDKQQRLDINADNRDPNPNVIETEPISKNNLEKQTCDRCSKSFFVKYPLEEYEKEECHYHFGALRSTTVEGSKVRAYTCCEATQGATGCSIGPHVFKEDTFQKLNDRVCYSFSFLDSFCGIKGFKTRI